VISREAARSHHQMGISPGDLASKSKPFKSQLETRHQQPMNSELPPWDALIDELNAHHIQTKLDLISCP
jgi:hypothetical protein